MSNRHNPATPTTGAMPHATAIPAGRAIPAPQFAYPRPTETTSDSRPHASADSAEHAVNEAIFLTVAEVATVMRVSKMTVYRLIHRGHLEAIRVGRTFRVPERTVHAYLRTSWGSPSLTSLPVSPPPAPDESVRDAVIRVELEELERQTAERPQDHAAQRALAEELTTLVHGADQTAAVIAASRALFGQGELDRLDEATLGAALVELPRVAVAEPGPVVDLLVETGLVVSKSVARRTVKEGGAYVNNVKVTTEDAIPTVRDLLHGRWLVLRRGKRKLAAVEITGTGV